MKSLLLGIALILLVGVGGLVYRNALEQVNKPVACPLDAKICPDGTSLARTGLACDFPTCPLPNITLDALGIAFALPPDFVDVTPPGGEVVAAYDYMTEASSGTTSLPPASIIIRRYPIEASSTALATIQATAIGGASGLPVSAASYSSTSINGRQFTVVSIERFEAVVNTAYYLARGSDVLRFDAIDRDVIEWTDPSLDISTLPAERALHALLKTLQGG
jgi:hypothetical protein